MGGRRTVESLLGVAGIWMLARPLPDYTSTLAMRLTGKLPVSDLPPDILLFQSIRVTVSVLLGTGRRAPAFSSGWLWSRPAL
jgi:hypothetical protein